MHVCQVYNYMYMYMYTGIHVHIMVMIKSKLLCTVVLSLIHYIVCISAELYYTDNDY